MRRLTYFHNLPLDAEDMHDRHGKTYGILGETLNNNDSLAVDVPDGRLFAADLRPFASCGARSDDHHLRLVVHEVSRADGQNQPNVYRVWVRHFDALGKEHALPDRAEFTTPAHSITQLDLNFGECVRALLVEADQFGWFTISAAEEEAERMRRQQVAADMAVLSGLEFQIQRS
jgi:hypothetical protein